MFVQQAQCKSLLQLLRCAALTCDSMLLQRLMILSTVVPESTSKSNYPKLKEVDGKAYFYTDDGTILKKSVDYLWR